MKKLITGWRFFEQNLIPNIATILFAISFGWMLFEALARRIFSYSYAISEEIVLFSLMWAVLLSLGQAGRKGFHIRIDMVFERLPKSWQKGVSIVTSGLSLFYSSLILISTALVIPHLKAMKLVSYTPLELPMWIVNLGVLIGAILLCTFYLESLIKEFLSLRGNAAK